MEKIYTISKTGRRSLVTLKQAQTWFKYHYDKEQELSWDHNRRLAQMAPMLEGITPRELWNTLSKESQKNLLDKANEWRAFVRAKYRPTQLRTVEATRNGENFDIAADAFEKAVDDVLVLTIKAALYKLPASYDWYGGTIEIPVTKFKIPVTDSAMEVFMQLRSFGIMTEYEIKDIHVTDGMIPTMDVAPVEFSFYWKSAKNEGKPFFLWMYENYGPESDGKPNEEETTVTISARVPRRIYNFIAIEANKKCVSTSTQVRNILEKWIIMKMRKSQREQEQKD